MSLCDSFSVLLLQVCLWPGKNQTWFSVVAVGQLCRKFYQQIEAGLLWDRHAAEGPPEPLLLPACRALECYFQRWLRLRIKQHLENEWCILTCVKKRCNCSYFKFMFCLYLNIKKNRGGCAGFFVCLLRRDFNIIAKFPCILWKGAGSLYACIHYAIKFFISEHTI